MRLPSALPISCFQRVSIAMDKIVSIQNKRKRIPNPIYLVVLIDLMLFGLLSTMSGTFDSLLMMLGGGKIAITLLVHVIIRKLRMGDPHISTLVSLILSIGLAMQLRLSMEIGFKQFIWYLIGMSIFLLTCAIFPVLNKRIRSIWLFYGTMIFLFVLTLAIGVRINGAKNWIIIGKLSFQPSEFIKILFVFFMAAFVSNPEALHIKISGKRIPSKWTLMGMVFILLGFFVLQREFGTALLIFTVYLTVVYAFEKAVIFIGANTALAGLAALIAIQIMPHLKVRVDSR